MPSQALPKFSKIGSHSEQLDIQIIQGGQVVLQYFLITQSDLEDIQSI